MNQPPDGITLGSGPTNASDRVLVEAQRRLDDFLADEKRKDILAVFNTPEGKRVLIWLLDESRALLDPFDRDPLAMANAVGHQDMGRQLIERLNQTDLRMFPSLLLHRLEERSRLAVIREKLVAELRTRPS